ncbi:hypothetical protein HG530_004669 [Fusarium avenaceum]|nr:hypothetical protein HG530_004669 [Fusarium avenaceum]
MAQSPARNPLKLFAFSSRLTTFMGEISWNKEDTRDTTAGVLALCVALGGIVTASQTSLVAGDRVLVSLDAAILGITVSSQTSVVVLQEAGDLNTLAVPA